MTNETLPSFGFGSNGIAMSELPMIDEGNPSGLEPLGRAILVAPFEPERKRSLIALPSHILQNERILDVKVRVIAVGPECWPDEAARCVPGDVVFVAKMSGFVTQGPKDGQPYRLVNDRDVFAKVTWFDGEGS